MSQFDTALTKAFVTDKFHIIRKAGVFDCKHAWNKWLGYSRFGSTRHNSSEAQAQGGRQEEPMCMHFFLGKEPANQGKALMRYKFREDDKFWAPYEHEGIPCWSSHAPADLSELLKHPGIREPRSWPERDGIANHLQASHKLSGPEKEEWRTYFMCVPACVEDITEDQLFEWKLPSLVQLFNEAKYGPSEATPPLGDGLGDSPRPEEPDERVLWPGFTAADARREAKVRAGNYQSQQRAYNAKRSAADSARSRQGKRGRASIPEDAQGEDTDGREGLAVGDMDAVFVGDTVLFSPDQTSRAIDERSGYKLGLNIGEVCELDQDQGMVELWWFFSSSAMWTPKSIFVPWRDKKTHSPYKDWIQASALLQDSCGAIVKLELTRVSGRLGYGKHTLSKDSCRAIQEVLGEMDGATDDDSDDDS
jgi:hypothetical protein